MVPMMDTQPLAGLSHSFVTDLPAGTVRNADAVLLLLHAAGGTGRSTAVKATLRKWRGEDLSFGYLFQSHYPTTGYGFVGRNFEQASNRVHHVDTGRDSTRRTYYYRLARGHYAVSAEGYRRLAELGVI